ncbi:MAG: hypothetical protein AAB576_09155 [Elusimicrobiota bacterium]
MKTLAASLLLGLAAPSPAMEEASFIASLQEVRGFAPAAGQGEVGLWLEALRETRDPARQLETLDRIESSAGHLEVQDQYAVVDALKRTADSSFVAAHVRARALSALGKAGARLPDEGARGRAARYLLDSASVQNPADSRMELRTYALSGLAMLSRRLPRGDESLGRDICSKTLDILSERSGPPENTLAMRLLHELFDGRPTILSRERALRSRLEAEVFAPLERDLDGLYYDGRRGGEYRYHMMKVLLLSSPFIVESASSRTRVAQLFERMELMEPAPNLKTLARLCARHLRASPLR